MSMTAIAPSYGTALDQPGTAPAATFAAADEGYQPCDFSGDGRLVGAIADGRSAWTCPVFYLAMPTCAVLAFTVTMIRMCHAAVKAVGGTSS
ncbi:MAG TPA: hypothetical protein VNJ10_08920 [Sphingomonas sp.]|nr:hypothetical protein [Sphingomonas sp.]